jgi:phospholipid/cholesterol/gamma-HCH transport system permease protein
VSSHHSPPSFTPATPLAWLGRQALATFGYLGGVAILAAEAVLSPLRRGVAAPPLRASIVAELAWMLGMGLPLVGLVHVGIGSFLSMQAYYGGTFVEGTGAVVGVGLIRNVAPMMACLTLAGLLAARITPELRALRREREASPATSPTSLDRTAQGQDPPATATGTPSSAVAARLIAAMVAGPVLSVWATAVGTLVGWEVGQTMMGVSTHNFFVMFWDMLWLRDVVGMLIKGVAFGLVAGMFSCHEGLRGRGDERFEAVATAACRAACFSALAIIVISSGWFILFYHAGPAFGPTLLAPPAM